ncbi:MAG: MerR family transcriptional regulator [Lachnospiraceae bacterium]|nr:MerR family transcriptional regulator [Lachnospiraceae bacterium]
MIDKRYIISDAAKIVEVESHVLRYWEDELGIDIPRNEMGHRYYTDFYINLFKKIKELKDAGFQLKAIKIMIPELIEMEKSGEGDIETLKEELFGKITEVSEEDFCDKIEFPKVYEADNLSKTQENKYKLEQFQAIINEVVSNALRENTGLLGKEVSDIVSDNVIKEMDYLMHIREKQEEERFKKLDETIRNHQILGKERQKDKKGILAKIKSFGT